MGRTTPPNVRICNANPTVRPMYVRLEPRTLMNKIILTAFLSLLAIHSTPARFVQIIGYSELAEESDCVMIVSVSVPTAHTGKKQRYWNHEVEQVQTRFKVQAVLKGKYESASWNFNHLVSVPDPEKKIEMDGMPFVQFPKADEFYLVFLKRLPDGSLAPVTGVDDSTSFVKLPEDFPTAFKRDLKFDGSSGPAH